MSRRARGVVARTERPFARPARAAQPQVSGPRTAQGVQPVSGQGAARFHHLRVRDARRRKRLRCACQGAARNRAARALQIQPDSLQSVPENVIPALGSGAHPELRGNPARWGRHGHRAQDARGGDRRGLRPARRGRGRPHAALRSRYAQGDGAKRVRRLIGATLVLLASACATQPPPPPSVDTGQIVGEVGDPQNRAKLHTELAALYYRRGSMAVALDELRSATSADSNYAPAYGMFGLVYMDLKENRLAQENFERGLKISPNDPDINHNYGWFLCQTGRETESIGYFERAIRNIRHPGARIRRPEFARCARASWTMRRSSSSKRCACSQTIRAPCCRWG